MTVPSENQGSMRARMALLEQLPAGERELVKVMQDGEREDMEPEEMRTVSGVVIERPLQPGTAAAFVAKALEMVGKPYIFGAETDLKDPSPRAFDCSELVQWAAAQAGVAIPDGARAQWEFCDRHDADLASPLTAMRVRGALLFRVPRDGSQAHVAISLGDGRTVEARGHAYPVGIFSAEGRGWTAGALVPGMRY